MKKKTLPQRAENYFNRVGVMDSIFADHHRVTSAWLSGYKAAQKDAHEKTYSRKWCAYCNNPKDGHKHKFCKNCKRITEHCECKTPEPSSATSEEDL